MSKKTRGEVARLIIENSEMISTPKQLQKIVSKKFTCDLIQATDKEPWALEVFC